MYAIRRAIIIFALLILLCLLLVAFRPSAFANSHMTVSDLTRINVSSSGQQANGDSYFAYAPQDARYISFETWDNSWFPNHRNDNVNVYWRDLQTGQTVKFNRGYDGEPANGKSFDAVFSWDGRYLVYNSTADNLVRHDNNETTDVFLYDRETGETRRINKSWKGGEINDFSYMAYITGNGRYILYISRATNVVDGGTPRDVHHVYMADWQAGTVEKITPDDLDDPLSVHPFASYNGRYVVYASAASNITSDVDENGVLDLFWHDRNTGETRLISRGMDGKAGRGGGSRQPQMTADGKTIVFRSSATNLVPNDNNGVDDIFLYDVASDTIRRVSVTRSGGESNGESRDPSICTTGRYISYSSRGSNILPNDNNNELDIFLYDLETGDIVNAHLSTTGAWANGRAQRSFFTPSCEYLLFASNASNLVPNDTNGARDIFMAKLTFATAADLQPSWFTAPATASAGDVVDVQMGVANGGDLAAEAVSAVIQLPAEVSLVSESLPAGATYDGEAHSVTWNGAVDGHAQTTFTFEVTLANELSRDVLPFSAVVTGDGQTHMRQATLIIDGQLMYMPLFFFQAQ